MSNLPGVGTTYLRYLSPLSPIGNIPILLNNNREGASPMNSDTFLAYLSKIFSWPPDTLLNLQ